jgi:polysaccharide biosynthesis transport protein
VEPQNNVLRKAVTAADVDREIPELARPIAPDIVQVVLRSKWMLLLGGLAGLVLGYAAYLKLGPSYQANARVLVSRRSSVPLSREGEGTQTFGERGEHVAIIMSPFIIEQAFREHELSRLTSLEQAKEPVQTVVNSLKVQRTAGSDYTALNVLDLTYDTQVQQDGITVLKAVIDAYNDFLKKSQQEYTSESVDLIRRANDTLLKELRQKEDEYVKFRQSAPLQWKNSPGREGATTDATNVHQERVVAIEAERRNVLLKRTEVQSKLDAILQAQKRGDSQASLELLVRRLLNVDPRAESHAEATGRAPIPTGPTARVAMEDRLLPLLIEEQNLLRDYGRDYPAVKAVRASIDAIRGFYQQRGVDDAAGDAVAQEQGRFAEPAVVGTRPVRPATERNV